MRAALSCLSILLFVSATGLAATNSPPWKGRPVADYLAWLNDNGVVVIYTSDLVGNALLVQNEPPARADQESLVSLLQPHGLTVRTGPKQALLVVRDPEKAAIPGGQATAIPEPIAEIVVTSSLHRLEYSQPGTHTYFDRNLTTRIPAAAEEAIRLTARLPGTASSGLSARNHVRGGEINEVLFLFDGLRLYEPYHLKDFQSVASIVNVNAIAGMDVYTGAYPARYGDRMSGVVDIELREPEVRVETELALSFFNTSALSLGRFGGADKGDWLFSARRGNLDLIADVINPEFGSPDYQDYLAHVGWDFGPRAQISANTLVSNDKISLVDLGRGERARAAYQNQVLWLKWTADWSSRWGSETILAISDISNERDGTLELPGIVSGSLSQTGEFDALEIRQDWRFVASDRWMLLFGINMKQLDAEYRFTSTRSIESPFDSLPQNTAFRSEDLAVSPGGAQYAVYTELRWQPTESLSMDLGLRWDQQNYTTTSDDKQYSPRASVLYRPDRHTDIRLGWGQYYQAQEINELQVSDGVVDYFPAQRAEHFVINVSRSIGRFVDVDFSLYRKSFRSVRPRFENMYNALTLVPELQFDRIRIDAERAEAHGAELTLTRGNSDDNLLWWVSLAWSDIEDQVESGKVKRSWDQSHTAKIGLSWRWGAWDFSAAAEAHTGWPESSLIAGSSTDAAGNEVLTVAAGERNTRRRSNYHSLDVRVSREFALRRGTLTAFFEVTNLYNQRNTCCTEYAIDATKTGADQLQMNERHWLPLVPSLGVVWRF